MIVVLPEGSRIFGPGQAPENFLLLVEGTIRVQQVSEGGREIVLYRVSAGESCTPTTACLMGYEEYLAEGIAETTVKTHLHRVFAKTGVSRQADLVKLAAGFSNPLVH